MRGELLENKSVNVRQHHLHLATYLPADIWLSELIFMSIDDDLDGCDEENFPRAILPMGLFSDGLFFDMMVVVVKDSWLPTVCGKIKWLTGPTSASRDNHTLSDAVAQIPRLP